MVQKTRALRDAFYLKDGWYYRRARRHRPQSLVSVARSLIWGPRNTPAIILTARHDLSLTLQNLVVPHLLRPPGNGIWCICATDRLGTAARETLQKLRWDQGDWPSRQRQYRTAGRRARTALPCMLSRQHQAHDFSAVEPDIAIAAEFHSLRIGR